MVPELKLELEEEEGQAAGGTAMTALLLMMGPRPAREGSD